jgi:hypothetical protein
MAQRNACQTYACIQRQGYLEGNRSTEDEDSNPSSPTVLFFYYQFFPIRTTLLRLFVRRATAPQSAHATTAFGFSLASA